MAETFLIVNADDFGRSSGLNRGIIEAHEQGIVSSASLMVRWPAAREAAAYAAGRPQLGVGLHLDFCEWTIKSGQWMPVYEVVPMKNEEAVENEVERQIDAFRTMMGRFPTHMDSHQHEHMGNTARPIVEKWGRLLNIPVRRCKTEIAYCGGFYGQTGENEPLPQNVTAANLCRLIEHIREGWTELACHPGYADDLETDYKEPRCLEVKSLCDPSVRAVVESRKIKIRSFSDFTCRSESETLLK